MFNRLARVLAVSMAVAGLAVLAAPAGAATTTIFLDSHNPVDATRAFCSSASPLVAVSPPGCGTAVTAPVVLTSGGSYSMTVIGAVSSWGAWPFRRCGKPEPALEFPSTGTTNRPAGDDAQFRFAVPRLTTKCPPLPKKSAYFQVNLGAGWFHPVANDNPVRPSNDNDKAGDQHPYTFTLIGDGAEPQFRYVDFHSSDNSGRFKITISG